MQMEHAFTVPVPVAQAWDVLLDVERVAPCMPGATLTSFDGEAFEGTVRVKLGPVSMTYKGRGRFASTDEANRQVVIEASGRDSRGGGTAAATATANLQSTEDGAATRVTIVTDLAVTGRPAQFGRGMIADVGGRLLGQFADCLATTLAEGSGSPPPAEPAAEAPIAAAPSPAAPAAEAPTAAAPPARPRRSADAIDLLQVTGISAMARKAAPYVIGFVVGGLVTWALISLFG
ncbi:MAG TPA: SRPBCC family protein [Micromonosporaceae bacterium]|jgi:carbon monoxide dehydrogenase subunit G